MRKKMKGKVKKNKGHKTSVAKGLPKSTYEGHDALVKGKTSYEMDVKDANRDVINRADITLKRMQNDKGFIRSKVKI